MFDQMEMRAVYVEELCKLAEKNPRIVLLDADLMKACGSTPFKEKFPDRFIDVGVAEQSLIGTAAGLANTGLIPFTHTFAPFATRRAFDHIAISVAYSRLPVRICGSDPGVTAELNGGTHMSFEDVALMRTLPGMSIFEPIDAAQLRSAMPWIETYKGPLYIRLNRKKAVTVYPDGIKFEPLKAVRLHEGKDLTMCCSGIMVEVCLAAAKQLEEDGIHARVLHIHTVKPLDTEAILTAAAETGAILTAENHNVIGGLGSAVAETVVEGCPVPIVRVGVQDHFGEVGLKPELMKKFHMTNADVVAAARRLLLRKENKS